MPETTTAAGPTPEQLLAGEAGALARRLLGSWRVENPSFFRTAIAGELVAPNGRRLTGWLALDAGRRLVSASCGCMPRQPPGRVCAHLGALVLAAARGPSAASPTADRLELPGERFERSPFYAAAEALVGRGAALVAAAAGERRRVHAADGAVVAELDPPSASTTTVPPAARRLATLLAGDGPLAAGAGALTVAERRLADLTRTAEEARFVLRGVQTQRQALEASPWWLLAKRAFELVDGGVATAAIEVRDARPFLVATVPDLRFAMALLPRALDAVARDGVDRLAALGLPARDGSVRPQLRLRLAEDGALELEPVYVVERGDAVDVVPRGELEPWRYGAVVLRRDADPGSGAPGDSADPSPGWHTLPVVTGRRPFAEPETGAQGTFDLGDAYRPSPLGQPLDRATRVPGPEVARFLGRHAAEIRALHSALLPPELAAGGPEEPGTAELTLVGVDSGRHRLDLVYRVGGRAVPWAPIHAARRRREPLLVHEGALVDPAHPRFAWMDALAPETDVVAGADGAVHLRLAALDVCRLRSYLPEGHTLATAPGLAADAAAALEHLAGLEPDAPPPLPESLGLALFDFQRTGYAWLWFLWRHGFGGLLCDDMGLGKTYQAIALLAAVAATLGRTPRALVVCPASVLPHWEEKLRTLVPKLPVHRHLGADRRGRVRDGVLLTTYGTLRNDADRVVAPAAGGSSRAPLQDFDLFVLDEMQTIKNRASATHQALRSVRARLVLGLTGTPVENHVEELRTLLDFALPGYLPDAGTFDRAFGRPIAEGDPLARARLARLVRPFVLRRTKEQVLATLPPKLEERRLCALAPGQAELYAATVAERGRALRDLLGTATPVPYLHVFALLSRLKQICDHPDLLLPPEAPPTGLGSGKWELFTEILGEALGSGHKVVVFSQYLRMLDRVAQHLDAEGVGHATLRGSTVDRAAPVRRFRDDPACRVFLASLKAAGVGIDLTAASVVVHYDRWWNAAREEQATDRVHRIGQRRGVQVITLVTEGTVEERIDRLIADKAALASELVPEEDARLFRRFTRQELAQLLAP